MIDLREDCEVLVVSEKQGISDFDCGNADLNDFFNSEAILYKQQMLSQTRFIRHKSTGEIVCAFAFSASSIKTADLPGSRRRKVKEHIPREKSLKSYPAILIGRLGVGAKFSGQGIGSQLIDFVKDFCLVRFSDFVRFLVVDAYNEPEVIAFYQKNDFMPIFSTEEQEKEAYSQEISEVLQTRYLFYDLMHWKNKI